MTITFGLALLLQVITIALLRHRLGRTWLRRPVTVLVLDAAVYDGVAQVMLLSSSVSAQDSYRLGVAPQFHDSASLLLSECMLAFTVAYLLARPERSEPGSREAGQWDLARALDWRLLSAAALPLAVLTYAGKGYNGDTAQGPGTALGSSLAVSFLLLLVTMAATGLVLRYGARWTLPALLVQSAVLAAAGERTPVIACGIALVLVLVHAGIRLPRIQLAAGAVLVGVAVLAITGTRATQGRDLYYADSGAGARVAALASGVTAARASGSLAAQAATRLDGVSFTAAVLQARAAGYPLLPAQDVPASLLEAVPSVLWSGKLGHAAELAPAQLAIDDDDLQQTNYLPGLAGTYAGFLSMPWVVALLALLGWLAGTGERRLLARCTPGRLVMLAGAAQAALLFDAGLPAMMVTLRSAVVLAVAVSVLAAARGWRAHRTPVPLRSP